MVSHKAGRPAKPARKKRQQLHISLYAEDLERLDQLTDNRSEFLRECIAKAWEEKRGDEVTLSVTLSRSLARELLKAAGQRQPRQAVTTHSLPAVRLKPEAVS
jgi:hypothetical protein